jgi:hypothetical protein
MRIQGTIFAAWALVACGAATTGGEPASNTGGSSPATSAPAGATSSPSAPPPAGSTDGGEAAASCPPMEHVCPCATGHYCLRMNMMCMAPSSACPPQ